MPPSAAPLPEPTARLQVLGAVLDYPGLHVRAIARLTGLVPSLVEYHAGGLLDAELITEATYAGYRRFFPRPGPHAPELSDSETLALLREPVPLHICLVLLDAATPLAHKTLAAAIPVAKSTLSFHLSKLTDAGVLVNDGDGYRPTDAQHLARLVIAHRPEPDLFATHFTLWINLYRRASETA